MTMDWWVEISHGDKACSLLQRFLYPLPTQDLPSVPDSARKIDLPDLELVTRCQIKPATHVPFTSRHQVHVEATKLQRLRDEFLEQIWEFSPGRMAHGPAHQVQIAGTVDRISATRIFSHR